MRSLRTQLLEYRSLTEAYQGKGVMVAFALPHSVRRRLVPLGTESSEDLHLTLAYMGTTDELSTAQLETLRLVAAQLAKMWAPLAGTIGGLGRFSSSKHSDGKDVLWASVDAPSLPKFRAQLVAALQAHGVPPKQDHGYTPHITLSYIDPESKAELAHLDPFSVQLATLLVAVGGESKRYALRGRVQ